MVINPIVGVYIPIIRIPIKGWMTIPNIATFDHGTYVMQTYNLCTLIMEYLLADHNTKDLHALAHSDLVMSSQKFNLAEFPYYKTCFNMLGIAYIYLQVGGVLWDDFS